MRVVESGVSVTATPSANQAARVNVRVPTQWNVPFCQPLQAMASRSGPCGRQWGGRCGESVLGRLSPTLGESTCHVDARSSHRHINNGSYEGEDGAKYGSHGVLGTLQAATAVTLESGNIEWSSEGVLLHFPGLDLHPATKLDLALWRSGQRDLAKHRVHRANSHDTRRWADPGKGEEGEA